VLRRQLSVGTIQDIDDLMWPAVAALRDSLELQCEIDISLDAVVQGVQFDTKKRVRQFWIQAGMPPALTYEEGQIWARAEQSRKDAIEGAWRARVAELERRIEARCRERMLSAGFCDEEMVGNYMPSFPRYVAVNDLRAPAFRAAMEKRKQDELAGSRLLGCRPGNGQVRDTEPQFFESPESLQQPKSISSAQKGAEKSACLSGGSILESLRAVRRELDNWNRFSSSPSETGQAVENVPNGHPLHAAVSALQPFYTLKKRTRQRFF
jgi:hypothetical protein